MPVVVDSSVAACWVLPDERSDLAERALEAVKADGMIVPPLFWYEFRNVLLVAERRRRTDAARTAEAIRYVSAIPFEIDLLDSGNRLLILARQHQLTIYDAAYLEVAMRRVARLATLDRRLAAAGRSEGVTGLS